MTNQCHFHSILPDDISFSLHTHCESLARLCSENVFMILLFQLQAPDCAKDLPLLRRPWETMSVWIGRGSLNTPLIVVTACQLDLASNKNKHYVQSKDRKCNLISNKTTALTCFLHCHFSTFLFTHKSCIYWCPSFNTFANCRCGLLGVD